MDAHCVDRPAAAVRADPSPIVLIAIGELVAGGYDVHRSREVAAGLARHPRLHPAEVTDHDATASLPRAVGRRGGSLALVVRPPDQDLPALCLLAEQLHAPRPRAGVPVLDRSPGRGLLPLRAPARPTGASRVVATTVVGGGRALRAVRRGLDAVTVP